MSKKSGKFKVSSGLRKSRRKSQNEKKERYKRNVKIGQNPLTGKEYFLFKRNGELFEKIGTYQTRYGAESNRNPSMIIKEKDAVLKDMVLVVNNLYRFKEE